MCGRLNKGEYRNMKAIDKFVGKLENFKCLKTAVTN
jgi:hypothetical protein